MSRRAKESTDEDGGPTWYLVNWYLLHFSVIREDREPIKYV